MWLLIKVGSDPQQEFRHQPECPQNSWVRAFLCGPCHLCCAVRITLEAIKPLLYLDGSGKRPSLRSLQYNQYCHNANLNSYILTICTKESLKYFCSTTKQAKFSVERISVIGIHRFLSAYLDTQKWKCHKSCVWRCIFSITVISERWWILTRLPQWITMQWQKFNTTASPHHPHERWIQNTDGHITFSMLLQLRAYKSVWYLSFLLDRVVDNHFLIALKLL